MLLIDTIVQPSGIHGLGCFTTESIRRGQTIWVYDRRLDLSITESEVLKLPKPTQSFLYCYCYGNSDQEKQSKEKNAKTNDMRTLNFPVNSAYRCQYGFNRYKNNECQKRKPADSGIYETQDRGKDTEGNNDPEPQFFLAKQFIIETAERKTGK